jgi:hypothetical protein
VGWWGVNQLEQHGCEEQFVPDPELLLYGQVFEGEAALAEGCGGGRGFDAARLCG